MSTREVVSVVALSAETCKQQRRLRLTPPKHPPHIIINQHHRQQGWFQCCTKCITSCTAAAVHQKDLQEKERWKKTLISHNRFNEDRLRWKKVQMLQCHSTQAVSENETKHCTVHGECNAPCVQFWWKCGDNLERGRPWWLKTNNCILLYATAVWQWANAFNHLGASSSRACEASAEETKKDKNLCMWCFVNVAKKRVTCVYCWKIELPYSFKLREKRWLNPIKNAQKRQLCKYICSSLV